MIKSIQEYFSKASILLNTKEKWIFLLSSGAFVSFFLIFFQPFGVNNYDPNETITPLFLVMMIAMGVLVSILIAINEFIFFPLLSSKEVSRKKIVLWLVWSIIWMSSGVFIFYNFLGNWHDLSFASYFQFIGNLTIVALLPISAILIYIRNRELRKSLQKAHAFTYEKIDGDYLLVFQADNVKDHFTLPIKYLVYIESEDNYVAIHHLTKDAITKTLVRKSLKKIEDESLHPALTRCHRSFAINLMHLQKIHGNRNKLNLFLNQIENPIPVSRKYIDKIYELIDK